MTDATDQFGPTHVGRIAAAQQVVHADQAGPGQQRGQIAGRVAQPEEKLDTVAGEHLPEEIEPLLCRAVEQPAAHCHSGGAEKALVREHQTVRRADIAKRLAERRARLWHQRATLGLLQDIADHPAILGRVGQMGAVLCQKIAVLEETGQQPVVIGVMRPGVDYDPHACPVFLVDRTHYIRGFSAR